MAGDAPPLPANAQVIAGARRINSSGLKRTLDVIGAIFGLIFLFPALLAAAVCVRLESPGPILFRQRRTGRGGAIFQMYKFRSMSVIEDGPTIVQASKHDPRVTRSGAFLRRSSIDELPQLLNVLKGDMSLIGPRPHAVAHDLYYQPLVEDYETRFLVRPGISGLAQVSGFRGPTPDVQTMAHRVAFDVEYIRTWTIMSDIRILIRTFLSGPNDPGAF